MRFKTRYKYRLYPNLEQKKALANTFGCARYAFNWALNLRIAEPMSYNESSARLTAHKKETDWLGEVSCVPVQQALRHLNTAFLGLKHGRGFPRFKSKKNRQSAEFTLSGFKLKYSKLHLGKTPGPIKVRWSRELPSEPTTATVTLEPDGRYFVTFVVEVEAVMLPATAKQVGIDLGLTDLIVTSSGFKSGNPRNLRNLEGKLALEQRRLSRKQKGSRAWDKQRRKVARVHSRIRDRRKDFLDNLSTELVRKNDLIVVEDLRVANMLKMRSLSKAISDASWSMFVRMLKYKCELSGRVFLKVNPAYTSRMCSDCGKIAESMPLEVRTWKCECEAEHDRDINAAINILRSGMTVYASGGNVSPQPALAT